MAMIPWMPSNDNDTMDAKQWPCAASAAAEAAAVVAGRSHAFTGHESTSRNRGGTHLDTTDVQEAHRKRGHCSSHLAAANSKGADNLQQGVSV